MPTKVTTLKQEGRLSYGIKVETSKETFVIPVLDVRDGDAAREQITHTQTTSNYHKGSRFMRPSYAGWGGCYQNSYKK